MQSNAPKPFYQKHSFRRVVRINKLKKLLGSSGQPEFIQSMSYDQDKSIFFLGPENLDTSQLDNKFIRIDNMVIPKKACMVNPRELRRKIEHEDGEAIDLKGLFYKGQMEDGINATVCGMVESVQYTQMHFHPCENKIQPSDWRHSEDGYETCPKPQLMPDTEDLFNEGGQIRHQLVVFHMPYEELVKSQGSYTPPGGTESIPNFTILDILQMYFADEYFPGSDDPKISSNPAKKKKIYGGGVFLLPMAMPDDRVAYYCVLNIDGESNRKTPVKKLLKNWLDKVEEFNQNSEDQWFGIAGEDATFCFIDDWSVFIGKNAIPLVGDKKVVFKESVLNSAVR